MTPRFRQIRMLRRPSRAPAPDAEPSRRVLLWLALVTLVATAVYFATRDLITIF